MENPVMNHKFTVLPWCGHDESYVYTYVQEPITVKDIYSAMDSLRSYACFNCHMPKLEFIKVGRAVADAFLSPRSGGHDWWKELVIYRDYSNLSTHEIRLYYKPHKSFEVERFTVPEGLIFDEIRKLPEIKNVIYNNPATIILWADETKTVVKCQDGDIYDPEKGMSMAIAKKALGNKGNFNDVFKKWECKDKQDLSESNVNFIQNIIDKFNQSMAMAWNGQPVDKLFEEDTHDKD